MTTKLPKTEMSARVDLAAQRAQARRQSLLHPNPNGLPGELANPGDPMIGPPTAKAASDEDQRKLEEGAAEHSVAALREFQFENWQECVEAAIAVLTDPEAIPDMFRVKAAIALLDKGMEAFGEPPF